MTDLNPADSDGGWSVTPIVAPTSPGRGRWSGSWRGWIAIVATLAVIATGAGMALVPTRAAASSALAYVPANAILYLEGRLDLPGDQAAAVASLISHFPGLVAAASGPTASSSTPSQPWDQLFARFPGSHGQDLYATDVAPWAEGTFGLAILPGPTDAEPALVALVTVADQARAQAEVDKVVNEARRGGHPAVASRLDGVTTWTFRLPDAGGIPAVGAQSVTLALGPGMLVLATDQAAIRAVEAVKSGTAPSLASSPAYLTAASAATPDNLATIFVSLAAASGSAGAGMAASPAASPLSTASACPLGTLPSAGYGTLQARPNGLVADLRAPLPAGSSAPTPHDSTLLDHVPSTAIAYLETHDLGVSLACLDTFAGRALAGLPTGAGRGTLAALQGLLGSVTGGGASWLGDVGLAVEPPVSGQARPGVALLGTVSDRARAEQELRQFRALVGLFAATDPSHVSVTDSSQGSATISTVTVAGPLPGRLGAATGGAVTADLAGPVSVSWTLADGRFLAGTGPGVVEGLLRVNSAESLGSSAALEAILRASGGPATTGFAYFDLRGIRMAAESLLPSTDEARYAEIRPYLLPFDRLVVVEGTNGGSLTMHAVLSIGSPG